MKPENIFMQLDNVLQTHHAACRMINIDHLSKAMAEIQLLYSNGSFITDFLREGLSSFQFSVPDEGFMVQSILIVTVPQPVVHIIFSWKGSFRNRVGAEIHNHLAGYIYHDPGNLVFTDKSLYFKIE